ncbi:MAG: class I SAM-dependent methyltransferase [Erysipelotrichaceae bacterium]|nr:class I SAM-dependent methyltransferase [Erysipelotrichaceae bacterium]
MTKTIWDFYAPVYERAMRADHKIYEFMYEQIRKAVANKDVLELATGPGMIAKNVADVTHSMIATDYSAGMIKQALKGDYPYQLSFEIAEATHLPYDDHQFDVVIIANALHIIPNSEIVLMEIERVLKPGGLLIAPNFVEHETRLISRLWSKVLKIAGISFAHEWTSEDYLAFLKDHQWEPMNIHEMGARITLLYTECQKHRAVSV